MLNGALYEALGVPRDAPAGEIKRAYRRKAKAAHPDTGGKRDEFEAIARAYAVLSDANRRLEYDRTGNVDERANNENAQALGLINEMMDQIIEAADKAPTTVDVVANMRATLKARIDSVRSDIVTMNAKASKIEKFAKRFERKRGDNLLRSMVEAKANAMRAAIVNAERAVATALLAVDLLDGYKFKADQAPNGFVTFRMSPCVSSATSTW
jgi:curved DNA-binding protein CbpA